MVFEDLYRQLLRARHFEIAVTRLWNEGRISGEMHTGTGEEAVAVGVLSHLNEEDSLALTHRCSPFLVARQVPLVPMIREMLGREDGLCGGRSGHMHLGSKSHRVFSSGIVGASLPTAAGFALAAKRFRPGAVAVAQAGDGSLNQGMALETFNLARAWDLPLLVVCIDNGWAITAPAGSLTGGDLVKRACAFGFRTESVDGGDLQAVYDATEQLIYGLRKGKGPAFLHATTHRIDGHYLGDLLMRAAREPLGDGRDTLAKVMGGAVSGGGGGFLSRATSLTKMMAVMKRARGVPQAGSRKDPVVRARKALEKMGGDPGPIEAEVERELGEAVSQALEA